MSHLAKAHERRKGQRSRRGLLLVSMMLLGIPGGCMQTLSDPISALRTDSTTTGSIPSPVVVDPGLLSDEDTIAASVGIAVPDDAPYPWSNSATGAAGVITAISVTPDDGRNCRTFKTSRHGFDGIALYSGLACQSDDGSWHLNSLERADS